MICFRVSNFAVLALTSVSYFLAETTVDAGVVYYIKPLSGFLPYRPYIGYGASQMNPLPQPQLKYIDYRWLNVKNAAVPLPVPGLSASSLPLLRYSQQVAPLSLYTSLPYHVPMSIVPVPYARRLQFIRLRRNSQHIQSKPEVELPASSEENTTKSNCDEES